MAGIALAAIVALFWPTLWSMIAIWWRSETFAHGFLVFPISGYIVWRRRHELASLPAETDFRALMLLLALGLTWTVARITDVLVIQQFAFVAMIPAVVWIMLGWPAVRLLLFPLGFLVFAVPFGEALIYPLMQFTAAFTVHMLRLTGLPVFWEGTFFSIPSGDWSVVEGCSGVRYLIASVFLGVLYAYMMYRDLWRRALFVALAVVVPIIANGLRAYMIVMIAHLSDMKLALGVDHFIYGWVFFGIVMFFLFWLGTLWREREQPDKDPSPAGGHGTQRRPSHPFIALAAGLLAVAVWPLWAVYLDHRALEVVDVHLAMPQPVNGWRVMDQQFVDWKPRYIDPTKDLQQVYENGGTRIGVYLAYYNAQEQGAELINSQNVLVEQKHPVWRMPRQYTMDVRINGKLRTVIESQLQSEKRDLLAWHWYWVDGSHIANPYLAKLREAMVKLSGSYQGGAAVVLYTPMGPDPERARAALQYYVDTMLPSIDASLSGAVGEAQPATSVRRARTELESVR